MKKYWSLLSGIYALLFSAACSTPAQIDLPEKAILIDVRTEAEFAQRFIPGSILIPHNKIVQQISGKVSDKKTPIVIFCRSGRRSAIAKKSLHELGFITVIDLGGINAAAEKLGKEVIVNKNQPL